MAEENKNAFMLLSMVAIVAVVGIVLMLTIGTRTAVPVITTTQAEDMAGGAYQYSTKTLQTSQYGSKTVKVCTGRIGDVVNEIMDGVYCLCEKDNEWVANYKHNYYTHYNYHYHTTEDDKICQDFCDPIPICNKIINTQTN